MNERVVVAIMLWRRAHGALVVLYLAPALGHGHLLTPSFRKTMVVGASIPNYYTYYPFENYQPISVNGHHFRADSFRCKDKAPELPITTHWTAGTSVTVQWNFEANHPGDCSLYLSYDADKVSPERWIKIEDVVGCGGDGHDPYPASNNYPPPGVNTHTVQLPSWLPSCAHCVFRWEWTAVHNRQSSLQQYVDCAEVSISGTSEPVAEFLQRVSPVIQISGAEHLRGNGDVRNPWYPYQIGLEFIAGGQALPGGALAVAQYDPSVTIQMPVAPPSPMPPPAVPLPPPLFSQPLCDGRCCVALFSRSPGEACEPVPVWDLTSWVHPGGSFVQPSMLCGKVRYNWLSASSSHGSQPSPQSETATNLPSRAGGTAATRVGWFRDPTCPASSPQASG